MAHITGGGITDNLPRILPAGMHALIDRRAWPVPSVFQWLQSRGVVPVDDMYRTFNMGIGLIIVCASADAQRLLDSLAAGGERHPVLIGEIRAGGEGVQYA
jgi:phosphoribosylformylglycinamidine cyclo-ligase